MALGHHITEEQIASIETYIRHMERDIEQRRLHSLHSDFTIRFSRICVILDRVRGPSRHHEAS